MKNIFESLFSCCERYDDVTKNDHPAIIQHSFLNKNQKNARNL
jgi:hypothetical protein